MDNSGRIYNQEQIEAMEKAAAVGSESAKTTLKELEPLSVREARFLADIPPHERKVALAAMREMDEASDDCETESPARKAERAVIEAAKLFLALEPFRYRYLDYDQQQAVDAVRKTARALQEVE